MILRQTGCGESPDRRYTSLPASAPDGCTGTVRRECEGVIGERVGQNPGRPTTHLTNEQHCVPSRVHPVCLASETAALTNVPVTSGQPPQGGSPC
jgi:hypothetical protein